MGSSDSPTSPLVFRYRWHTGSWGPCSATCGVGIQTRDVYCLNPGEAPAPAEECRDEKPHALQACSQFHCPPSWHIEEWQQVWQPGDWPARQAPASDSPALTPLLPASQCSRTCGGGTQSRRVTCRQLLTDGSFLSLSDELCQGPKASSHKSCARTDCPPHLTVGDWSKVRAVLGFTGPASCPPFLSATKSGAGTSAVKSPLLKSYSESRL